MRWFKGLQRARVGDDGRHGSESASAGRPRMLRVVGAPVRFLAVPLVTGLLSGYVRGASTDQVIADVIARLAESLWIWLGSGYVHPTVAWALVRCLEFGLWSLGLLIVAAVLSRIHGLSAFLVISEIARRQGRNASAVDQFVGLSLLLAAAVALARYDEISLLAWIWFCVAYVYVRLAYDPPKAGRLLDWMARLQGSVTNGGVTGGGV